jgi:hypothetical protein
MKKYLYDVLTDDEINSLLNEYNNTDDYISTTMNKASPGSAAFIIDKLMFGYKRVGGNYYKHNKPYLPHTDHREDWGDSINVVVPLHTEDPDAALVVFDQKYHKNSVTWCLNFDLIHFDVNTGIKGRPFDYKDVEGLTNEAIDDKIYEKLSWAPKDQWYGLTGQIMPFIPGNLMIFNNKYIHSTGVLNGTKTGLSLRYQK